MSTLTTSPKVVQEHLAQAICLFLAELLRSRKIELERASDIAATIVSKLDQVKSEEDFLKLTKKLESEFQEFEIFERQLEEDLEQQERARLERLVKDFAAETIHTDPHGTLEVMQYASKDHANVEEAASKFPKFNEFLKSK